MRAAHDTLVGTLEPGRPFVASPPDRPARPGFVTRGLAFGVDIFAMALLCTVAEQAVELTANFFGVGTFVIARRLVSIASRAAVVLVIALYLPLSWTMTGKSLGKAIFGLKIVRPNGTDVNFGRSVVRFAGYWLSALPFGLGYLCALTDERRRALHDRLAGTLVVYGPRRRV